MKKLDMATVITINTAFFIIATAVYLISYSTVIGCDFINYMRVEDFINLSFSRVVPILPFTFIGLFSRFVTNERKIKNSKFKSITSKRFYFCYLLLIVFIFTPQIGNFDTTMKLILSGIVLILLIFISRHELIEFIMEYIEEVLPSFGILLVVLCLLFGSINAYEFNLNRFDKIDQVYTTDGCEYIGNIVINLSNYTVMRVSDDNYITFNNDIITKISNKK